jgi:hypothetical protein
MFPLHSFYTAFYNLNKRHLCDNSEQDCSTTYWYTSRSEKRAGKKSKREDWGKKEEFEEFLSIKLYKIGLMLEKEREKIRS